MKEGLIRPHQVEIVIGVDVERLEHLVEHGAMLGGDTDLDLQGGVRAQPQDNGAELDSLRPGSEYEEDSGQNGLLMAVRDAALG